MKRSIFIVWLLVLTVFGACQNQHEPVTNAKDYESYLLDITAASRALANYNTDIAFWNQKLTQDTGNYVFMLKKAYLLSARFHTSGRVEDLFQADTLLQKVNQKLKSTEPSVFYTLSQNAVTRHQFRQAMNYNEAGMKAGGQEYITNLLRFDVGMELGQYRLASQSLRQLKDKNTFDYLIRKAKLKDHEGDLDSAIVLMEQAFGKVKNLGKKSLYCWALSNLGDMYGHANRIEDSYQAYLQVLKTDPSYHYALKGVAWIAFSHDKNTPEAKRIYTHLLNQTHAPDLHLNLAEIAEFEGNLTEKKRNTDAFLQGVSQPKYGEMYNKYLVHQYIEAKNSEAALQIAQRETENRPTPETFDLLAWVYLQQGNPARALSVAETEIANRTFEPEALYHLGMIYQANNQTQKAEKYLEEALESEYELGPVVAKAIRQALQRL